MASMVTGRACRQVKRDHGRAGPSVEVSAGNWAAGNHDAGSGRPVTTEAHGTMRLYTGQHQFYAGIDLHARSLYAHVLDSAAAPSSIATCPPHPTPSSMPSSRSARGSSS